jgi:hypothetical protein
MEPTSLTEKEGEVVHLGPREPFVSHEFPSFATTVKFLRRELQAREDVCTLPFDLISCEVLGPSHAHTVDRGYDTQWDLHQVTQPRES